jgi:hypothetical protein
MVLTHFLPVQDDALPAKHLSFALRPSQASRQMLDHYSHIRMDAKRKALQVLETPSSSAAKSQSASQNEKPPEEGKRAFLAI